MTINEEEHLEHYGILGMKWGHHKAKDSKAARKAKKNKYKKSPTKMYKHRDQFSDEEIQKSLKRMKLERELRDLSRNEQDYGSTVSRGIKKVKNGLATTVGVVGSVAYLSKTKVGQEIIDKGKEAYKRAFGK